MPDEDIDVTQGSSPASESQTPDTGAAASDTQPVDKAPEAAAKDQPSTTDSPEAALDSKSVVKFFSEKKQKTDKSTVEEKPAADAAAKKPTEEKPKDELFPEFTEQERKLVGPKVEKRVRSLVSRATAAEAKVKEYEPLVEQGKVFGEIVSQFKLDNDLEAVEDAQVAGHIKFQAAINRAFSKRATREDIAFMQNQFAAIDKVREHFGMAQPAKQSAPAVDTAEFEKAIEAIRKDFDFATADALIAKLKTAPKPQQQKQETIQPQQNQQPIQPQQPQFSRDTYAYSNQLAREWKTDGVADPSKYMTEKIWPAVLTELQQTFPGEDPSAAYSSLSPRAQYDIAVRAHQGEKQKAKALKSTETRPKQPPVKPATGSKTKFGETPSATGANAAIKFFSGSKE